MIDEGAVVLVPSPQTETGSPGKVRPAVVIRRLPGAYDDWLICMLSSRVDQSLDGFDEVIT
jgi:mRNA interferase MazF